MHLFPPEALQNFLELLRALCCWRAVVHCQQFPQVVPYLQQFRAWVFHSRDYTPKRFERSMEGQWI